jgi:hypothetical protein
MQIMVRAFTALSLLALLVTAPTVRAQVVDTTVTLSYYDPNASYLFFPLPGEYGVTSGQDTARTVTAYSERFSSPWPDTYIDSVWIAMRVDKLQESAVIPITVDKAMMSNGHFYVDTINPPYDLDAILAEEAQIGKVNIYAGNFLTQPKVDSTFFITVSALDLANTQVGIAADDITLSTFDPTIDEDVDRARLILDQPYQGQRQLYMAGTQWPMMPGVYDYSNFVMIAHVSNFQGSTADVYPASVDPLKFFVEKHVTGGITLHYTLSAASLATIVLYDARGVAVQTLLNDRVSAGSHEVHLYTSLPNGMYYAVLAANRIREVRPVAIAH